MRPQRQDAARNRRLLLETAREFFIANGLDASIEDVAKLAGLGIGTLYRHFPSKEDLVVALLDDLTDQLLSCAEELLRRDDGSGLWDFLHAAGRIQADAHGLVPRLWKSRTSPGKAEQVRTLIRQLTDDSHRHHQLRAGVTAADIILLLHGQQGVIEGADADHRAASERYLSVVVDGLRSGPVTPPPD